MEDEDGNSLNCQREISGVGNGSRVRVQMDESEGP